MRPAATGRRMTSLTFGRRGQIKGNRIKISGQLPLTAAGRYILKRKGDTFLLRSNWQYHRGDIYWADLNPVTGSEQGGIRPVVVLQNNCGNNYSPTLIVAAVTSKDKKKPCLPTHFLIKSNPAFTRPSVVLLEQIRTIDKSRIIRYSGSISPCEMLGIEWALIFSLSLEHFIRRFIPGHLLPLQPG